MEKGLDRPRHTMGVFHKKCVAGPFDQADFHIRQQLQQVLRGFGRDQPVETGEQVQLRARNVCSA